MEQEALHALMYRGSCLVWGCSSSVHAWQGLSHGKHYEALHPVLEEDPTMVSVSPCAQVGRVEIPLGHREKSFPGGPIAGQQEQPHL